MAQDMPPSDDQVLAALRQSAGGVAPSALFKILTDQGHTPDNVVAAIQRVFDRGLVQFTPEAKLVEAKVKVAA